MIDRKRLAEITKFILALFFLVLTSLMFFPKFDWEPSPNTTGTIKRLAINSTKYGTEVYYFIELENGREVKVKAPLESYFKKGDIVSLKVVTEKKNKIRKRYTLDISPSNPEGDSNSN